MTDSPDGAPPPATALPEPLRHVHFVAIGGTGVGSLAGLLHSRGIRVTGSDRKLYPPMSTALERWGIPVHEGFAAEHVRSDPPPDLVVIGNAVRADNPEARAAIDGGLPYLSFSDALYLLAMADRKRLVVSGTHGKTTTTSLAAYLLHSTGRDPSLLVGGISEDFDGSFRDGAGPHFVVEGDEYDTAFFDKTPKFLHYHPDTLILTSVEFDHADIYRDLAHVESVFRELCAGLPQEGCLVAAWRGASVRAVAEAARCELRRYGVGDDPGLDWRATDLVPDASGTRFRLATPAGRFDARVPLHGAFNVENAVAALAALDSLGVPPAESVPALEGFRGVKRRQEVRGERRGVTVVDDFAHHPTAVASTLEAMRGRYAGRRIVAVLEPRTNTSRRAVFQDDYARALAGAEVAWIREVGEEPIYSATGEVGERLSAERLAGALRERGVEAHAFEDVARASRDVAAACREGDVVVVMSNGAFDDFWGRLLAALA